MDGTARLNLAIFHAVQTWRHAIVISVQNWMTTFVNISLLWMKKWDGLYVSLTVHVGVILVNNQLDPPFFNVFIYFTSLHVSSNPVLIIRRIELYQYIIWYMSLSVGDCLVCQSGIPGSRLHRVIYTRWCIDTFWFYWWWVLGCSKHVENWNK